MNKQPISPKNVMVYRLSLIHIFTGMFAGGKLSDDALDGAMRALNEAYWIAKDKNKKYGRKKKKDAEDCLLYTSRCV